MKIKIVVVAEGHPRERPILKYLSHHFPGAVWIRPVYSEPDLFPNELTVDHLKKKFLQTYTHYRDRFRRQVMHQKIGPVRFDFEQKIKLPWFNLNRKEGLSVLEKLQPDLIVTCCSPILSPDVLQRARLGGINAHFGIAPAYRGIDALFWALMHRDPDGLGGTIHRLEPGINTGDILAYAYPRLKGRECLTTIEEKISYRLSEGLVKCLKKVEKYDTLPPAKPQGRKGRNYRKKERTLSEDLRYLLRRIGYRTPVQEEAIELLRTRKHHPVKK